MFIYLASLLSSLVIFSFSLESGWILNATIPANEQVLQLIPWQSNHLLVQTTSGIHIASFINPNLALETVVNNSRQEIPMSSSASKTSFIYYGLNSINYQQVEDSHVKMLPEMGVSSNLIMCQNKLYFFSPIVHEHLMVYDLDSDKIQQGPYIADISEKRVNSVLMKSQSLQLLYLSVNSSLFVIEQATMRILQKIVTSDQINLIEISPSGRFLTLFLGYVDQIDQWIYRLDHESNQYVLIYGSSNMSPEYRKKGFTFDQQKDICRLFSNRLIDRYHLTSIIEFGCSQPYSQVVDRISDEEINICLADDKKAVFFLNRIRNGYQLIKKQIKEDRFELQYNKTLPDFQTFQRIQILKVSLSQILLFRSYHLDLCFIWDAREEEWVCDKISGFDASQISFINFDPNQTTIYFVSLNKQKVLWWINLEACTIESKTYMWIIKSVVFLRGKIFLKFLNNQKDFYQIDENTKDIMDEGHQFNTNLLIVYEDTLYGIAVEKDADKIVRYNQDYQPILITQIPCSLGQISFFKVSSHLSVTCNNAVHEYDQNLQYLGSSIIFVELIDLKFIEESYAMHLRINLKTGQLYSNQFKMWNTSSNMLAPEHSMISDLYFYNSTDAVYLARNNQNVILAHAVVEGLNFTVKKQVDISLKNGQDVPARSPLKWSCSKQQILLQHHQLKDDFHIYINVYEVFTFKLLYSYRVDPVGAPNSFVTSEFVAELDCSNNLYVSLDGKLDIVKLAKRGTIIPQQITDVHSLALSNDGSTALAFGRGPTKIPYIEVWNMSQEEIISNNIAVYFSQKAEFFSLTSEVYIIDQQQLYKMSYPNFDIIFHQISDCQYLSETLLCIKLNGEFVFLPNSSHYFALPQTQTHSKIKVSLNNDALIIYNSTQITIFNVSQKQIVQSNILKLDIQVNLAVISDSRHILIYSKDGKSYQIWQRRTCPARSTLVNGHCVCIDHLVDNDGNCICPSGYFLSGQECQRCSFFCSECINEAGKCSTVSAWGKAIIIILAVALLILGFLVYRCVKRWRGKGKMTHRESQDSEFISQYSSIND